MPSFDALFQSIGGKQGIFDVSCPLCGPLRASPGNRLRRVLRVWYTHARFHRFFVVRAAAKKVLRATVARHE